MRKILSVIAILFIVIIAGFCSYYIFFHSFKLSPEFYDNDTTSLRTVSYNQLRSLRTERKTFIVLAAQEDCRTADDLRKNLQEIVQQYGLVIFETTPTNLEESGIADDVRFYPSLLIFRDGKLKDYLDANDPADVDAYTTRDGLEQWLSSARVDLAR